MAFLNMEQHTWAFTFGILGNNAHNHLLVFSASHQTTTVTHIYCDSTGVVVFSYEIVLASGHPVCVSSSIILFKTPFLFPNIHAHAIACQKEAFRLALAT
jgi:hypothetical protein